jgi:hypothetical protein
MVGTSRPRTNSRPTYGRPEFAPISDVISKLQPEAVPVKDSIVLAFRYPSVEAFADGNERRHGHRTLGPVECDGSICGVTVLAVDER